MESGRRSFFSAKPTFLVVFRTSHCPEPNSHNAAEATPFIGEWLPNIYR